MGSLFQRIGEGGEKKCDSGTAETMNPTYMRKE